MLTLATILAAATTTVACAKSESASKGGICDRKMLRSLDAIEEMGGSRFAATAALTAEACALPAPIEGALADISMAGDCMGAARGVAEAPDLFLKACPAGHDTVRVLQENDPATGMALLSEKCGLPKLGFATQSELAGSPHWGCTLLGSMVHVALHDAGEPEARRIARLIALDRP